MEIVAVTTHWLPYIVLLTVTIAFALMMWYATLGGVLSVIDSALRRVADYLILAVVASLAILFTFAAIGGVIAGPDKTYTARVTDFNDVYARGYEIVGQNGKLFEIKEAD